MFSWIVFARSEGQDTICILNREYSDLVNDSYKLDYCRKLAYDDSVALYLRDGTITLLYDKVGTQDLLIRSKDAQISVEHSEVKVQKVKVVKRTLLAILIGAVESSVILWMAVHK